MVKYLHLIVFGLLLFLISGCWNQVEVNDTAVCAGLGTELNTDNKIIFTTQLNKPVNPQTTGTFKQQVEVLTATGDTVVEAARKIMLKLPRLPLWSHADTYIIGSRLAKEDLSLLMDFVTRNRDIRYGAFVLVSTANTPDEVFTATCPLSLCSSRGILKILQTQESQIGIYVPVTLKEFLVKLSTPGIDPVVPQVVLTKDLEGKDVLTIDGMAVFKENKMAGSLDAIESRGYRWIMPKTKRGGIISVPSPSDQQEIINLEINRFNSKITPVIQNGEIILKADVNVQLNVLGVMGRESILNPQQAKKIEDAAGKQIEKEIAACIDKSQILGSDILGLGRAIHRYYPKDWEKLKNDWAEIYPDINYQIEVETILKRGYLTSKVFTPR